MRYPLETFSEKYGWLLLGLMLGAVASGLHAFLEEQIQIYGYSWIELVIILLIVLPYIIVFYFLARITRGLRQTVSEKSESLKEKSQKLTSMEIEYSESIKQMIDGFALINKKHQCIGWNKAAERITGVSEKRVRGKDLCNVLFKTKKYEPCRRLETTIKSNKPAILEKVKVGRKEEKWLDIKVFKVGRYTGITFRDVTERVKADLAMRENEAKYKMLYNSSMDAIMLLTKKKGFFNGNPATIKMFGCKNEKEFTSMTPADLSPKYQSDGMLSTVKAQKMIEKAIKNGSHFFEWTHKRRTGEEFFATVLLTKMELDGKKVLQATVRDITERKKGTEALKKAKETAENYLNVAGVMIIALDRNGDIILLNKEGYKILGYKKDTLIGKNWFKHCLPKRCVKTIKDFFFDCMKGKLEVKEEYESPIITKKGEERIIRWRNTALRDDKGEIIGTLSSGEDITEKKKAEDAIKESEERFRNLVETTSDWVWEVDKNSIYTYASPKIKDMLGYGPKEVLGKNPFDFMPPEVAKSISKTFSAIASKRKPFSFLENINLHKDGHEIMIETSGVPIFDREGRFAGYRGIDRDITEKKKAEENLKNAYEELKKLDRARDEFISISSHELKKPLIPIIGYGEILLKKTKDKATRDKLKKMVENAVKLNKLATKITKLTKLRLERKKEPKRFNMSKTILNVVEDIKPIALKKKQKIKTNLKEEWALGNKDLIKTVLANLIENAVKFTQDKGKIMITTKRMNENIVVSVKDNGIGIPQNKRSHIFERFYQVEPSLSREHEGIGIGLALSKGIVEKQGGKLWFQSTYKKGSTFCFILPIKKPKR